MIKALGEFFSALSKNENSSSSSATPVAPKMASVTIDDIIKIYSDKVNETALNEELSRATIFVGGDFNIDYVDEKSYTCSYTLFFQNKSGETYEIKAGSKPLDISRLVEEARQELTNRKSIKFDIPEMSEEVRGTYKVVRK